MTHVRNKLIAVMMAVMVAVAWTVPAFADDEAPAAEAETKAKVEKETEPAPPAKEEPAQTQEETSSENASDESTPDTTDAEAAKDAKATKVKAAEGGHSTFIEVNNDTTLADGEYDTCDVTFTGGTGKTKITCDKVIVSGGKAKAVIRFSSTKMTHFFTGTVSKDNNGDNDNVDLYNAETGHIGEGVYKTDADANGSFATIPVSLGSEMSLAARSTAMTEAHWITYAVTVTVNTEEEPSNPDDPSEPVEPTDPTDPEEPIGPDDPQDQTKLEAGTYKVKATTDRQMFNLYPKDQDPSWQMLEIKKDGSMTATIILNGTGYDYVYMGTPDQARSAGKGNWIKGVQKDGYYSFTIPVSALDKKLAISPHSWKYETDANPMTDPWRPNKWIIFYSKDAKKVDDGSSIKPDPKKDEEQKKPDKKEDKESKWKDDKNKSTHAVDNSTNLKDGVYTPDKVSWSGGSGRLAYIHCTKVTVKGGKAYGTIVFASSKYDSLKANGRVYSKSGGGNSTFVIPIKLNANNTIIGRTTAMSQPHWIKYRLFVYIAGATSGKDGANGDGGLVDTNKLSDKAPELLGLENTGTIEIKHAKLFKIYTYEQGVTLISVDQNSGTALYKKPKKEDDKAKSDEVNGEEKIEYDEDGKPIPKSEVEITNELYQNNVVNYIVAPEDVELPAGIEKDCIIIKKPIDSAFVSSEEAVSDIEKLGQQKALENNEEFGKYDKPDYKKIVLKEADLAVLPADALPAKVTKKSSDEDKELSEEKTKTIQKLQTRYSSLSVPLLVDRSTHEASNYGKAEWVKVYGAIFGEEKAADDAFDKFVKKNKKEKLTNEN